MCVVSMITDHYQQQWPVDLGKYEPQPWPGLQPLLTMPVSITRAQWEEYQALKRKAEEYDKRTGQPECVKPHLAEWESAMEEHLRKYGVLPSEGAGA